MNASTSPAAEAAPRNITAARACQIFINTIHGVEQRCMAADGPVTPTHEEITDVELRIAYAACVAALDASPQGVAPAPASDELLRIARLIEGLKRECGMDPESPTAIQNGRYMSIAAILRALAAGAPKMTPAAADVLAERERQKVVEGWTPEHDDEHASGELAVAAACYAMSADQRDEACELWPWEPEDWRPKDERSNLVRAGALILAEIERLDRAAKNGLQIEGEE